MNKFIEIELSLPIKKTFPVGEVIEGTIKVLAKEAIELSQVGYEVKAEHRGLLDAKEFSIKKQQLSVDLKLSKGESKTYQITFINSEFFTYLGVNASQLIRVLAYAVTPKANESDTLLDKINPVRLLYPDHKFETEQYVIFENNPKQLKLKTKSLHLKLNLWKYYPVCLMFGFPVFVTLNVLAFDTMTALIYAALPAVVGLFLILLLEFIIGSITVRFETGETPNTYWAVTENDKRWRNVSMLSTVYQLREKVIDNRGTSIHTKESGVWLGPSMEAKNPSGPIKSKLSFEEKAIPNSSKGDLELFWQFQVKVHLNLGLHFTLKEDFEVIKTEH